MNYIRAILGQPAGARRSLVSALQAGAGFPGAMPGGISSPQSHSLCPPEPGAAQDPSVEDPGVCEHCQITGGQKTLISI